MRAGVRSLSYGRRAAIGPLAPNIIAAAGAPGTVVPVPVGAIVLTRFVVGVSSFGVQKARVKALSFAPTRPGPARAAVTLFPAFGQTVYFPGKGSLLLSPFVPSVTTASVIVTTPTGNVVLTGLVADDGIGIAGAVVAMMQPELRYRPPPRAYYLRVPRAFLTEIGVPGAVLVLATDAPLLDTTGNLVLAILPGGLALGPNVPELGGLVTEVDVPLASLGLTGLFPSYSTTQNVIVLPSGALVRFTGFASVLPPGPISIGIPLAPLLLLAGLPRILTERLKFHTPLRVTVLPHATTVVVAPHQTTLEIL